MKNIFLYGLFFISLILGCSDSISSNENNEIIFHTSSNYFSSKDSIIVLIENKTNSDFKIALRCGSFLEMYYQKKNNDSWSKNLEFSWMTLKCASINKTIKEKEYYQFTIPQNEIDSSGTFRLILSNDFSIKSNSFEIN